MRIQTAAIFACTECHGEGREYRSRYGGNDPDVWDAGECKSCNGSGNETCSQCGDHLATAEWKERGKTYLVCSACYDEFASG